MRRASPVKSPASRSAEEAPFLYVLAVACLLPSFAGGLLFVFFAGKTSFAGAVLLTIGLISALACWTAGAVVTTSRREQDRRDLTTPSAAGRRLRG